MKQSHAKKLAVALGLTALLLALAVQLLAQMRATAREAQPVKSFGSRSAPITMEIFSDFECPGCRELYLQTLRPMMNDYVSTGKVYLVHRDFPLAIPDHKHSREATRYANAAAQIQRYEKVAEALYSKQQQWRMDGKIDAVVAEVLTPAEMKQVRELVRSGKVEAAVESDTQLATQSKVWQTPTMFITHKGQRLPISGYVPYTLLRRYLDQLLGQ